MCGGSEPRPYDRLVLAYLLLGHAGHLCRQVQKLVDLSEVCNFCGWFSLPCRYDVLCYGCNIVLVEGCFVAPSQSCAFKSWSLLRHTTVVADTSHCS
jgi:hypothetical protein